MAVTPAGSFLNAGDEVPARPDQRRRYETDHVEIHGCSVRELMDLRATVFCIDKLATVSLSS